MVHIPQVENDLSSTVYQKVADGVPDGFGGGTESDFPAEIQNMNISDRTSVDFQSNLPPRLSIMCRNPTGLMGPAGTGNERADPTPVHSDSPLIPSQEADLPRVSATAHRSGLSFRWEAPSARRFRNPLPSFRRHRRPALAEREIPQFPVPSIPCARGVLLVFPAPGQRASFLSAV